MFRLHAISTVLCAVLVLIFDAHTSSAYGQTQFTPVDLGGDPWGNSKDVNDLGQVVGSHFGEYNASAFTWSASGGLSGLAQPWGDISGASAINDHGDIVGYIGEGEGLDDEGRWHPVHMHAFRWNAEGGGTELGTLPGGENSSAEDINEAGYVVGWSQPALDNAFYWWYEMQRAVLWTPSGTIQDLGTLGGETSIAYAINDSGAVVGASTIDPDDEWTTHAFIWTQADGMQDLGAGKAYDINNRGQVVGLSNGQAVLWDETGSMQIIGEGTPYGVNESGHVVGSTYDKAFFWTEESGVQYLTREGSNQGANSINAHGIVVGQAEFETFANEKAVVWVPTPSSMVEDGDFEEGTSAWRWYTNGRGIFYPTNPGYNLQWAANIDISVPGSNVQLYQTDVELEPNQQYRLHFAARSSNGNDISVLLHKHESPYTNYGLNHYVDLSTDWQEFTLEFTTSGFSQAVSDARLRFWFAPYDAADTQYQIDYVLLEKIDNGSPLPPDPLPIAPVVPKPPYCNWDWNERVRNGVFEGSTFPWMLYSSGRGMLNLDTDSYECYESGRVNIIETGSNMQLYQSNLQLEPDTTYLLRFAARSSLGHDVSLFLHQHTSPFTNYGLNGVVMDLSQEWQVFQVQFTTTGFATPVEDGRLRFWFVGHAARGEQYWFDDVVLNRVGVTVASAATDEAVPAISPSRPLAVQGDFIDNDDDGRTQGIEVSNEDMCASVTPDPAQLWPPDNEMRPVTLRSQVSDDVSILITQVEQDEPVRSSHGDKLTPDAIGVGTPFVALRAQRLGNGDGRVYTLHFTMEGAHGLCHGLVTVDVPHRANERSGLSPFSYNSTGDVQAASSSDSTDENGWNVFLPLAR